MIEFVFLLSWMIDNIVFIILAIILLWQGKTLWKSFVLEPLRGKNGKVQMDEFAKYILVIILIYMIYREGQEVGSVYPESVFWAIIVGVALIGGIKEFAGALTLKK